MNYNPKVILSKLKNTRKSQKLSQHQLSKLSGIPQPQLSKIEAGAVDLRLSSLIALANVLGLEVELVPRRAIAAVRHLSKIIPEKTFQAELDPYEVVNEQTPAYTLDEGDDNKEDDDI